SGSKEGDLTFVAGHPGRTSRLFTVAHLEYLRDHNFQLVLAMLHDREASLLEYGKLGPEQFRQSKEELFSIQNSRKAREGGHKGLNDPALMRRKAAEEQALRARIAADSARAAEFAGAWDKIAASKKVAAEIVKPYNFLERG